MCPHMSIIHYFGVINYHRMTSLDREMTYHGLTGCRYIRSWRDIAKLCNTGPSHQGFHTSRHIIPMPTSDFGIASSPLNHLCSVAQLRLMTFHLWWTVKHLCLLCTLPMAHIIDCAISVEIYVPANPTSISIIQTEASISPAISPVR